MTSMFCPRVRRLRWALLLIKSPAKKAFDPNGL